MATLAPLTDSNAQVTPELFDTMLERGDFEAIHIELLNGTIVFKMSQNRLDILALSHLIEVIAPLAPPAGLRVITQGTIRMGEDRPEPDFALLDYDSRRLSRPLVASDVRLAVEVAVTSLATDRRDKAPFYASQGIPEYWIINPVARQVEIYRQPSGEAYGSLRVAGEDEAIDALALPGSSILVADLMPLPDSE
ncbi:Uma2 family endonuclease [bacterium]|nr:MAG: Uma2 family endonuclease [bacterium]